MTRFPIATALALCMATGAALAGAVPAQGASPSGKETVSVVRTETTVLAPLPITAQNLAGNVKTSGDKASQSLVVPNMPCEDCNPTPPCYPQYEYCENFWVQCDLTIGKTISRGQDANGIGFSRIGFSGTVSCRGSSIHLYPVAASAQTMLIDRTDGRYDVNWYGNAVGGNLIHNNSLTSTGEVVLSDNNYPLGKDVEVGFELVATITGVHPANTWDYCVGGSYQLHFCSGVGTLTLHGRWGTGSFSSQLQPPPPLFIGAEQNDDCRLSDLTATAPAPTTINDANEHRVVISYRATIACKPSVTGNSKAVLRSRDPFGRALGNKDLQTGNESGVNGTSQGQVNVDEHEDGGRRVVVIYSGKSTAPANRTWGGCRDAADGSLRFTTCNRNGNIVDWTAEGRAFDTNLPPELRCRLDLTEPHVNVNDGTLEAGAVVSCEEPAERMEADMEVVGDYTANGLPQRTATYRDDKAGGNTQSVTLAITPVRCKENDQTSVSYSYKIKSEVTNVGGWIQKFPFDNPYPVTCVPD